MVEIDNPISGLKISLKADDPLGFDEMLREMASENIQWLNAHKHGADAREVFEFSITTALMIAKRHNCSETDWYKFCGYAGLLAAQSLAYPIWKANQ